MPYWGHKPADNDYAFDAVSAYVYLIKERMFKDMTTVLEKSYPEQGIVASVQCLRLIAKEFPKCVRLHFRKKELERAKAAFENWYDAVCQELPEEHREALVSQANLEFQLFDEQVLI